MLDGLHEAVTTVVKTGHIHPSVGTEGHAYSGAALHGIPMAGRALHSAKVLMGLATAKPRAEGKTAFFFEAATPADEFPKTAQNVGPQCKRSVADGGEDNAIYKTCYHSCVHCPGTGECANPLLYRPLLFPFIEDMDCYLALLGRNPDLSRVEMRFPPAWRARRSDIEVLADRAAWKHDAARRIGVPP